MDETTPDRIEPLREHPWAAGPLGPFLAEHPGVLLARFGRDGRLLAAGDGLRGRLATARDWPALLAPRSRRRWQRVLAGDDQSPRVVRLGLSGPGGAESFRGLIHADDAGSVWLLGLPEVGPTGESPEIARLREALARARRRLGTDPLTGLADRRRADRALRRAIAGAGRTGEPLACLMVDLDRFKRVNDERGHPTGDRALRIVARGLARDNGRPACVARYGGDEFLAILPGVPLAQAAALAEQLRDTLTGRLAALGTGISVGLAAWRSGESPAALLARADAALRRAKQLGRDRVELERPDAGGDDS
jgi:diguanylate cyclase (GGDEF)-like protein